MGREPARLGKIFSRREGERKGTLLREFPVFNAPSDHANSGKWISKSPLTVGRAEYFGRRESEAGGGLGYFWDLSMLLRSFVVREFWHVSLDNTECERLLQKVDMMFA